MDVKKAVLIFTGTFCVGLGMLGMFLPLLPTTVFLLMAAYCYSRSSNRFHNWLLNNRLCGEYISNYKSGSGITARQKATTVLTLWASIAFSVWALGGRFWATLLLVGVALGITTHILWLKTKRPMTLESNGLSEHIGSMLILLIAITAAGCGGTDRATSNGRAPDTKANAEEILAKMTEKIKSAPALSFTTAETADRPKRGGGIVKLNINRSVTFKSPDRMYFKTTGDRDLEAFYDGKSMILVTHKDKVWGKLIAPPTLGETIDKIKTHYGMPLPVADLLGLDAKGQLRNPANTGGIEKRETVGGVECNVLAFQNPDVDWQVWIPVSGDPLPKKFHAKYRTAKGQPESTFEFSDWNLSPQITDDTFIAKVPDDYEGIPIIQRASAVLPKIEEEETKAGANANANANTAPTAEANKK